MQLFSATVDALAYVPDRDCFLVGWSSVGSTPVLSFDPKSTATRFSAPTKTGISFDEIGASFPGGLLMLIPIFQGKPIYLSLGSAGAIMLYLSDESVL